MVEREEKSFIDNLESHVTKEDKQFPNFSSILCSSQLNNAKNKNTFLFRKIKPFFKEKIK
jgi:hypothetical protein